MNNYRAEAVFHDSDMARTFELWILIRVEILDEGGRTSAQ